MQNYIYQEITMHRNPSRPANKKKYPGLELISDFTLNSDNYDMKFYKEAYI
jgi:hypothetical protein